MKLKKTKQYILLLLVVILFGCVRERNYQKKKVNLKKKNSIVKIQEKIFDNPWNLKIIDHSNNAKNLSFEEKMIQLAYKMFEKAYLSDDLYYDLNWISEAGFHSFNSWEAFAIWARNEAKNHNMYCLFYTGLKGNDPLFALFRTNSIRKTNIVEYSDIIEAYEISKNDYFAFNIIEFDTIIVPLHAQYFHFKESYEMGISNSYTGNYQTDLKGITDVSHEQGILLNIRNLSEFDISITKYNEIGHLIFENIVKGKLLGLRGMTITISDELAVGFNFSQNSISECISVLTESLAYIDKKGFFRRNMNTNTPEHYSAQVTLVRFIPYVILAGKGKLKELEKSGKRLNDMELLSIIDSSSNNEIKLAIGLLIKGIGPIKPRL